MQHSTVQQLTDRKHDRCRKLSVANLALKSVVEFSRCLSSVLIASWDTKGLVDAVDAVDAFLAFKNGYDVKLRFF